MATLSKKRRKKFYGIDKSGSMEKVQAGNTKEGKYNCTVDLLFDWFGISCMATDNFCFYLQNRIIQTSQKGG